VGRALEARKPTTTGDRDVVALVPVAPETAGVHVELITV
jgi:hypothetical protein